jgi:hypothetical protein
MSLYFLAFSWSITLSFLFTLSLSGGKSRKPSSCGRRRIWWSSWRRENHLGQNETHFMVCQTIRSLATSEPRESRTRTHFFLAKVLYNFELSLHPESVGWEKQKTFFLWEKKDLMVWDAFHGMPDYSIISYIRTTREPDKDTLLSNTVPSLSWFWCS